MIVISLSLCLAEPVSGLMGVRSGESGATT